MSSKEFTALTFAWLHQVNQDAGLLPIDTKVCLQLTKHFNEKDEGGRAWPSYKTIGEAVGVSEQTVIRSVHRVHSRGHLRVVWGKAGRGHPNQYWMIVKPPPVEVSEDEKTSIRDEKTSIRDEKTSIAVEENHLKNHYRNQEERETRAYARAAPAPDNDQNNLEEERRTATGSFLPRDWQPSGDDFAFGLAQGLTHDQVHWEADKFRDYWHSVSGARAKKYDWAATWRIWVRRTADANRTKEDKSLTGAARRARERLTTRDYLDADRARVIRDLENGPPSFSGAATSRRASW
jgi:Helix-turn-helix domain